MKPYLQSVMKGRSHTEDAHLHMACHLSSLGVISKPSSGRFLQGPFPLPPVAFFLLIPSHRPPLFSYLLNQKKVFIAEDRNIDSNIQGSVTIALPSCHLAMIVVIPLIGDRHRDRILNMKFACRKLQLSTHFSSDLWCCSWESHSRPGREEHIC